MKTSLKKSSVASQPEQMRLRLQQLLADNLDCIGQALVDKAKEGNYNAAQLLLRMGGLERTREPSGAADMERQQSRIVFLEMVEQMIGRCALADREHDDADKEAGRKTRSQ